VLISSIFLPVLQISGSSMEPVLNDGEIVVLFKTDKLKTGDICSFTWNNRILNKRVIACPGDTVDIDTEGNITVNGKLLDEPYVREKSLGQCDVEFPVTVGKGEYFFAGDRRESSIDSRSSVIGNVPTEQIIGKIVFRVWPIKSIGIVG
ncbi:MAG: signal peptidase I, partial [Oscillospiraceae bacterium]|nr:signal peptidase I [Oscillospiraceae bacterium]